MAKHRVEIFLDDNEELLVKWLAREDGTTVAKELSQLLSLQIWEEMQLHGIEAGVSEEDI